MTEEREDETLIDQVAVFGQNSQYHVTALQSTTGGQCQGMEKRGQGEEGRRANECWSGMASS